MSTETSHYPSPPPRYAPRGESTADEEGGQSYPQPSTATSATKTSSARVILPHRVQRVAASHQTSVSDARGTSKLRGGVGLQGDVALTDLTTIGATASATAQSAMSIGNHHHPNNATQHQHQSAFATTTDATTEESTMLQRRAQSSLGGSAATLLTPAATSSSSRMTKARVSSAVAVFRAGVAEASAAGGGHQAPMQKLVNERVSSKFAPSTNWFNESSYHPTNVTLSPLLQEKQLQDLKELMFAPSKKKAVVPVLTEGAASGDSAFLTSTNFNETAKTANAPAASAPATGTKKGKNVGQNTTSHLNGKIGLRRLPNTDVALNDLYAAHSVALKPPEAPLYGGALTTEGGKKKGGQRGSVSQPVMLTTANVGSSLPSGGKKKKGPVAPLISNIAAIHRGLAPYVEDTTGHIAVRHLSHFLATLVPPEHEVAATSEYIRPFLKKVYNDYVLLQQTGGGSAVAGSAGADAEDALNQTTASGTTDVTTATIMGDNIDANSTIGGRSNRAASRAGTVRVPSVIADGAPRDGSRAASPANTTLRQHNGTPSTVSLGRGAAAKDVQQHHQLQQQQLHAREKQEEERFFASAKLPYVHVVAAVEELLKPPAPVSNMIADDVSGALLSARVCFQLCDPNKRGYITKESVKFMRSDLTTAEDFNFNVVQGLVRALGIVEKLEEERFAMIAKKQRKGKKSKKAPPMPTVRQFHISLDEFTHLLSTDAYIALAFLPYIIKTLMNGKREEVAAQHVPFYGKSQVAFSALGRANYREKRAAETNMATAIDLESMNAEEIATRLAKRTYPAVTSSPLYVQETHSQQLQHGTSSAADPNFTGASVILNTSHTDANAIDDNELVGHARSRRQSEAVAL